MGRPVRDERVTSLDALIEHSPLAIVLLDSEHKIRLVNPAFESLFLYDAEEIVGANIDELIAPAPSGHHEEARELTRRVLAGEPIHRTTRRRRKDGTEAEVEIHGVPLINRGRLWGVYAIYQDVGPRRRAEDALRQSEEKYREIVNLAPLGFFRSTADRRLLIVNDAMARILGYDSPEEILRTVRSEDLYFNPRERQALIARYDPGGGTTDLEVLFRKKDGNPVWVQIAYHITRDGRGRTEYIQGFILDISERKKREEELQRSEERFRSIVAGALDAVITFDTEGTVETFNPAAERIFGYRPGEAIGLNAGLLVPGILSPESGILGRIAEMEGLRKNGEVFPLEASVFEISSADRTQRGAFLRDITERRQVEKLKDDLVAMVSHELKTPLTAVRLSLGLLADGTLGPQTPGASRVIAIADQNLGRLVHLTNAILDFKRIEAQKDELKVEEIPIDEVIAGALRVVEPVAEEKTVTLSASASAARVRGDAARLHQVLVNLLSNAVKFSPVGGAVRIEVRTPEAAWVEVRVIDQGRGVPAEHRESIFEPFRQVAKSDADLKGGTGLGLAICRAIVRQHGGSIGLESELGKGSTFWFRVPAAP